MTPGIGLALAAMLLVGAAIFGEALNWRKRFGLAAGIAALALFAAG